MMGGKTTSFLCTPGKNILSWMFLGYFLASIKIIVLEVMIDIEFV